MSMPPLDTRTCQDLIDAKTHIENLMAFVTEERRKNPGPGWDLTFSILERDLLEVQKVIADKSC